MRPLALSVEQSEGKLEVAQARFALGLATNKDVTDAQESLLDAERDLLESTVDYKIGLAELEASIAGTI
jgi:outer membrane protein TolC